ncbi:hypothetical protein PCASD_05787 [Puccinia coronata f. sp. avenae]|uniref:Dynamin GTPase domain-containing protein n=2 Tax=Puccinia coronata f. sp. avenae TaxID=200324 RepID=A0A2N5V1J6_9BASI|nr:hypothetical protein PCASD_05787 [Puccinia coronata f. sp. avenae]
MLSRFRESRENLASRPGHSSIEPQLALPVKNADRIRRLMEQTRPLKSSVGHQSDTNLPKIVVLGGSLIKQISLVECITGVRIPREFEHDQRAPIEFRMISSTEAEWSCQLKIRYEYSQGIKQSPAHVKETAYGEVISDPSKVEPALRAAHNHLLQGERPTIGPRNSNYDPLSGSTEKIFQSQSNHTFSKNVISLEIHGDSIVDLTLVTLPNFAPIHSNRALQDFVLADYLETNSCILLLTRGLGRLQAHPAFGLAMQVDPMGTRIIGLFSIPDGGELAHSSSTANLSRVFQSGFRALRSPAGKTPSYALSKQNEMLPRRRSDRSLAASVNSAGEWKVMRWQGPFFSEATFEATFDDSELVIFLGEIFCELLQQSMPKLPGASPQLHSRTPAAKAKPQSSKTIDKINDNIFPQIYADCATDVNRLVTSIVSGEKFGNKFEEIYELLEYRAFSDLPLFVPVPSQKDDHPAFKQLSELADMDLYAEAYQTTDPKKIDARTRRPRVYLAEIQESLKSMNSTASSGASNFFCEKTPLMESPVVKWKIHAQDALSDVIRLLQDAVDQIIEQRCVKTPTLQPEIKKLFHLRLEGIFSEAKKSLYKALEFELVPYTQSLQRLGVLRARLLEKYQMSRHLLNRGEDKRSPALVRPMAPLTMPRGAPRKRFPSLESKGAMPSERFKPKMTEWEAEVNAAAEAGAYLNLGLCNLVDTTALVIEEALLDKVDNCDLAQLPSLETELMELVSDSDPRSLRTSQHSGSSLVTPSTVVHLVEEINNLIQDETEELLLLQPFQC